MLLNKMNSWLKFEKGFDFELFRTTWYFGTVIH